MQKTGQISRVILSKSLHMYLKTKKKKKEKSLFKLKLMFTNKTL